MSNINYRKSIYNKRNAIIATAALALLVFLIGLFIVYRNHTASDTQLKIVHLSSLHPTYESAESMLASNDAALVAEAVVVDDGQVIASPRSGDGSVPPRVSTVYKVELGKIIKGHVDGKMVSISLMGGIVDKANYVAEGVPKLHRGDRVVFFASRGDDGKYYPLSGSTAIARINDSGQAVFTDETISGESRSLTIQNLEKMTKE